jgi:hypothetical protein
MSKENITSKICWLKFSKNANALLDKEKESEKRKEKIEKLKENYEKFERGQINCEDFKHLIVNVTYI